MSVVSQSGELESIVQVKNVSKVYSKNTTASAHLVLNNLNIHIKEGEFLDIKEHQVVVKHFVPRITENIEFGLRITNIPKDRRK
jgi:hypothetical protein